MEFYPKDKDPRLDERSARFHARVLKEDLATLPFVLNTCNSCLLYTSPSPRDQRGSRMPSSA